MTFDKEVAHGLVERAINQLKESGYRITSKQHDLYYRVAMIGVMASFVAQDLECPPSVHKALTHGVPLNKKSWQEILGES